MEYIEQPPAVPNKKKKIIFYSVVFSLLAILLAGIGTGAYFLIANVFIEYLNVEYIEYSYRIDTPEGEPVGVTIEAIEDTPDLPEKFRIPNVLDGYPVVAIADSAFAGLSNIKEVIIPDTVTSIGMHAFANCKSLEKFNAPRDLVSIGTDAFLNTAWYENHSDGPVEIGQFLYKYKGTMPYPTAIASSEATYDILVASGEYEMVIPLYETPYMSEGVFAGQTNLVYVDFPDTFDEIVTNLFKGCTGLETVFIGDNVTKIDDYAFADCTSLANVFLPQTIESIGVYAFQNTLISGDLSFTANLTYLGEGAFSGCSKILSFEVPENITSISAYLFNDCTSLASVTYANDEFSLNSKITTIGNYAFANTAITEFYIPFATRNIQASAFQGSQNLKSVFAYENTDSATASKYGLYTTGTNIFRNCTNFKELVLVDANKNIITNRDEVSIPSTLQSFGSSSSDSYLFSNTAAEVINVGKGMTFIAKSFASSLTSLREINFPAETACKSIGSSAFSGTSLTSFIVPDVITSIGVNAFDGCQLLANIVLPNNSSFKTVTDYMLANCPMLTSIVIPDSVSEIGRYAFQNCSSLANVTLSNNSSLTTINQYAFQNCISLTSFIVPKNVTTVAAGAFSGCTSLVDITFLPTTSTVGLRSFGDGTFQNCTSLETIYLPTTLTTINKELFKGCTNLSSVYIQSSTVVTLADETAFEGTKIADGSGKIYVPNSLLADYLANTKWAESPYADKLVGYDA